MSSGKIHGAYSEFTLALNLKPNNKELNSLLLETLEILCFDYNTHCDELEELDFNFYERKRLKEEKLNIDFESVHCQDIGLYVIGKYPRLQFGGLNFSDSLDWSHNAKATIRLTILNLINNGVIEVVKVLDSKTYFFKLFKGY